MSDEGYLGRIAELEDQLGGMQQQLQITQQLVDSVFHTLGAITGGKMFIREGTGVVEINVPFGQPLVKFMPVAKPKKSSIITP